MRIIHALCTASYTGRGDTTLEEYERVIMIKSDGSILIHSDNGTKPLNYMGTSPKPTTTENNENGIVNIRVENTRESLLITCSRVFSDIRMDLPVEEPGLSRDGTEEHVHAWVAQHIRAIDPSLTFKENEHNTDNGPVDILAVHDDNRPVLVEIKRVATVAALHQLKRYVDGYKGEDDPDKLLIALDVRPKTRQRAEKMGIPWVQLHRHEHGYEVVEKYHPDDPVEETGEITVSEAISPV